MVNTDVFSGENEYFADRLISHFELGYIPEQALELKTAAGLLIAGFMRQHIISLHERVDHFQPLP